MEGRIHMPPHNLTYFVAGAACLLYALVAATGGVVGYVRKGSKPSLIAGSASGLLLFLCAVGVWFQLWYAAVAAMIISLLLVGRFAGTLAKERRVSGGINKTPLGRVALAMVGLGLVTAILNAIALLS
jgi:uncharacterized membrane protein (UPF0136 family)